MSCLPGGGGRTSRPVRNLCTDYLLDYERIALDESSEGIIRDSNKRIECVQVCPVGALTFKNATMYADVIFPIKHGFSLALEFQNIKTTVVTATGMNNEVTGTRDNLVNVFYVSGMVNF